MPNHEGSLLAQAVRLVQKVATGQHVLSRAVPVILLLLDALLCVVIIKKVPCESLNAIHIGGILTDSILSDTEIDWKAYMEQIQLYEDGEREYTKIKGGTGPLVYPAAHVWIYRALYNLTNHGNDILLAQRLFAGLYLVNLGVVMACYRKAKVCIGLSRKNRVSQ